MKIASIKSKAVIFTLLIMLLPLLTIGGITTIYYYDVIKDKTWDNNLAQAKTTSMLISRYVDSAKYDLELYSFKDVVDEGLLNNDTRTLTDIAKNVHENTDLFISVIITDPQGKILAAYPENASAGWSDFNRAFSVEVGREQRSLVSDPVIPGADQHPTVLIGAPVTEDNSVLGTIQGALDLNRLSDSLYENQKSIIGRYIYIVNSTGRVFVHNNKTYMDRLEDFSNNPAVKSILQGQDGVKEYRDPIEHVDKVGAFAPVKDYGWGVVVSRPLGIAYKPIYDSVKWLVAGILLLSLVAIIISLLAANHITRPVFNMVGAVKKMDVREEPDPGKAANQLPYMRGDELGELARSLKEMSDRINATSQRIIEDRNRAEFYVDLMAHDITNMNQALLMSMDLLMISGKLTENEMEYAKSAINSIHSITEVIENVKLIQKVTKEKQNFVPLDVDKMLQECIESVPRSADKSVDVDYHPGKGRIIHGLPQFKTAFCQIIENSIKYSDASVRINIDVIEVKAGEAPLYVISIADDGHGIPPESREDVFRGRSTREGITQGRGLGLFIARLLVERSCGRIRVEDRIPGDYTKGSRFVIELPVKGESCSIPDQSFE